MALTVIPMLASKLLKEPKGDYEAKRRRSKYMNTLERSIRWSLKNRMIVLSIAVLLFVGGIFGLSTVGMQFLPPTDEGFFSVNVDLENGAALSQTEKVIKAMEDELKTEKDVDVYVSLIGSTQESAFQGNGRSNTAEVYVKLKSLDRRDQSMFEFVDKLKPKLEKEDQTNK